jgi:hypothetical protein
LVEFNIENDDYNAHRVRASNDVICLIWYTFQRVK